MKKPTDFKGTLTTCSRGHKFYKSRETPVCPQCWPGRYKKEVEKKDSKELVSEKSEKSKK